MIELGDIAIGYDDFPLRSDFNDHDDWLNEVRKSQFNYSIVVSGQIESLIHVTVHDSVDDYYEIDLSSYDKNGAPTGIPVVEGVKTRHSLRTNHNHTIVIHYYETFGTGYDGGINVYSKSKDDMNKFIRIMSDFSEDLYEKHNLQDLVIKEVS